MLLELEVLKAIAINFLRNGLEIFDVLASSCESSTYELEVLAFLEKAELENKPEETSQLSYLGVCSSKRKLADLVAHFLKIWVEEIWHMA